MIKEQSVRISVDSLELEGTLVISKGAKGIVIFVHGSGSSRHSPRNIFVAQVLNKAGIGTLLFDLLTEKEDEIYETRFDIPLLTERIKLVTQWVKKQPQTKDLNIGYFGASTGAAAAINAAADLGDEIKAVVSRGGRPDIAEEESFKIIQSPTLLIVGGEDHGVIELNEQAYSKMVNASKELSIVPEATHLFEEEGALEEVSHLASEWFKKYLS